MKTPTGTERVQRLAELHEFEPHRIRFDQTVKVSIDHRLTAMAEVEERLRLRFGLHFCRAPRRCPP